MTDPLLTDPMQHKVLARALAAMRADGEVLVGPWTGEVGFELLYWIPFLTWLAQQGPAGRRMVIVSRGGAAPWYRHLSSRYVDILDLVTPEEFRERSAGKKKQYDRKNEFDRQLFESARDRLALAGPSELHPATMFRLFAPLWRGRATIDLVEAYSSFQPLTVPLPQTLPVDVPDDYVVAKFYFSKAFPETSANKAFISDVLRVVSRQVPIVLLSTTARLDEHSDYQSPADSGVFVVDAHEMPNRNLERQTALIAGARGFLGTYGGFSYLAPFYGVPSLSFFSRVNGFGTHHLELARRVFDRLLPGGFVAVDRRTDALVSAAVSHWSSRTMPGPAVPLPNEHAGVATPGSPRRTLAPWGGR
jgi:hypothetical protein